jgi:hypothetical protein
MMNKKVRAVFRVIIGIVMVFFALGGIVQTVLLLR